MSPSAHAWHLVAHRSLLAKPGDFICMPKDRTQEVAVTNMDGEIVAFDNRCPHRGARIFTENTGNRPPVCGYHGRCAKASEVRRFHTAWVGDFLFINSSPLPPPDASLSPYDFLATAAKLRPHSSMRWTYDCHWSVAVENALDNEHVAHVHGSSLAKMGLRRTDLRKSLDGSSIERFESLARDRLDRIKTFAHCAPFDYAHAHFFPYSAVASTRGWTYSMQHYIPRLDGRTEFITRLFVQTTGDELHNAHAFAQQVHETNRKVFLEDDDVCALVQPGHASRLGAADDRIEHFRSVGARTVAA